MHIYSELLVSLYPLLSFYTPVSQIIIYLFDVILGTFDKK